MKVRELIREDTRQIIHDICNRVGPSYGSCQSILAVKLNMRRIATKFVPRRLNNEQRDLRVQVCIELQEAVKHDSKFLPRVITGDESWLYDYDPEKKAAFSEIEDAILSVTEKSAPSSQQHQVNVNLFFFDIRGIVQ
jgi:hypothetical protein